MTWKRRRFPRDKAEAGSISIPEKQHILNHKAVSTSSVRGPHNGLPRTPHRSSVLVPGARPVLDPGGELAAELAKSRFLRPPSDHQAMQRRLAMPTLKGALSEIRPPSR